MKALWRLAHRAWLLARPLPPPTIVHVTHWKAGSQWIHRILHYCAAERVVRPDVNAAHFLKRPIQPGMVYPTVYATKEQYERMTLPRNTRRFLVLRDLRDTLVSWYFSMRISHVIDDEEISRTRAELAARSQEDGLLWSIGLAPHFSKVAAIQQSWLRAGEPFVRYEDLLDQDEALFQRVLLDQCGLGVSRELLSNAVRDCRFERLTAGRPRGTEDVTAHCRKGIAGDWRNHLTAKLKLAFKQRYGHLLVAAGYERDDNW